MSTESRAVLDFQDRGLDEILSKVDKLHDSIASLTRIMGVPNSQIPVSAVVGNAVPSGAATMISNSYPSANKDFAYAPIGESSFTSPGGTTVNGANGASGGGTVRAGNITIIADSVNVGGIATSSGGGGGFSGAGGGGGFGISGGGATGGGGFSGGSGQYGPNRPANGLIPGLANMYMYGHSSGQSPQEDSPLGVFGRFIAPAAIGDMTLQGLVGMQNYYMQGQRWQTGLQNGISSVPLVGGAIGALSGYGLSTGANIDEYRDVATRMGSPINGPSHMFGLASSTQNMRLGLQAQGFGVPTFTYKALDSLKQNSALYQSAMGAYQAAATSSSAIANSGYDPISADDAREYSLLSGNYSGAFALDTAAGMGSRRTWNPANKGRNAGLSAWNPDQFGQIITNDTLFKQGYIPDPNKPTPGYWSNVQYDTGNEKSTIASDKAFAQSTTLAQFTGASGAATASAASAGMGVAETFGNYSQAMADVPSMVGGSNTQAQSIRLQTSNLMTLPNSPARNSAIDNLRSQLAGINSQIATAPLQAIGYQYQGAENLGQTGVQVGQSQLSGLSATGTLYNGATAGAYKTIQDSISGLVKTESAKIASLLAAGSSEDSSSVQSLRSVVAGLKASLVSSVAQQIQQQYSDANISNITSSSIGSAQLSAQLGTGQLPGAGMTAAFGLQTSGAAGNTANRLANYRAMSDKYGANSSYAYAAYQDYQQALAQQQVLATQQIATAAGSASNAYSSAGAGYSSAAQNILSQGYGSNAAMTDLSGVYSSAQHNLAVAQNKLTSDLANPNSGGGLLAQDRASVSQYGLAVTNASNSMGQFTPTAVSSTELLTQNNLLNRMTTSFIQPGNVYDARASIINTLKSQYSDAKNQVAAQKASVIKGGGTWTPQMEYQAQQTLQDLGQQIFGQQQAQAEDSPERLLSLMGNAPSFYGRVRPIAPDVAREYDKQGLVNPQYGFASASQFSMYQKTFGDNTSVGGSDLALPGLNIAGLLTGKPSKLGALVGGGSDIMNAITQNTTGAPNASQDTALAYVMQQILDFLKQQKSTPPPLAKPMGGPATTGPLAMNGTVQRSNAQSNFPGDTGNGLGKNPY